MKKEDHTVAQTLEEQVIKLMFRHFRGIGEDHWPRLLDEGKFADGTPCATPHLEALIDIVHQSIGCTKEEAKEAIFAAMGNLSHMRVMSTLLE